MTDYNKIAEAVGELEEEEVLEMLRQVMVQNDDAQKAMEACQKGLQIVGDYFQSGEYFVGDLVFAGEIMQEAVNILKPALVDIADSSVGKIILCTVKGDLHDIGKNIVKSILEAGGMEVIDLGIDVPAEKIIEEAEKNQVSIIGLSGVLTLAIGSMKDTVELLKEKGLRDSVKVIIGGAPVTADTCACVGADAWATNPQTTLHTCLEWAQQG